MKKKFGNMEIEKYGEWDDTDIDAAAAVVVDIIYTRAFVQNGRFILVHLA